MSDTVTLCVPPKGEYAKTVRLVAASLATRVGMGFDQVEDLRMAAEEAFVFVCDRVGGGGEVEAAFDVGDDAIALSVSCDHPVEIVDEEAAERAEYAKFILEAVCDELDMPATPGGCGVRIVIKARAEAPGA